MVLVGHALSLPPLTRFCSKLGLDAWQPGLGQNCTPTTLYGRRVGPTGGGGRGNGRRLWLSPWSLEGDTLGGPATFQRIREHRGKTVGLVFDVQCWRVLLVLVALDLLLQDN